MTSIRTVLIILITATSFIVFSLQAYSTLSEFQQFSAEQIQKNLLSQAEKEADKIYAPMRGHADDAVHLAALVGAMPVYDESLAFAFMKKIIEKKDLFSGASLAFEPGIVRADANFYLSYVYKDQQGNAQVDWSYNGPQYFTQPWYQQGMSTTENYVMSPPYRDAKDIVWLSMAAPIIRGNTRIGVATADMVIDNLCEYVAQLKVGQQGYAYLLTADGTYLGKDKAQVTDMTQTVANEVDPARREAAETIRAAKQAGLLTLPAAGLLVAYAPVGDTGLRLVLVYVEAEILQNLHKAIVVNALGFLATIVIYVALLTFVINRRVVKPLARLVELVKQVTEGNLTSWPDTYRRPDEIGVVYRTFQQMVISLRVAREELESQKQILSAKNAELERFTYTVSHDLRSPLITIKGFAGMIAKDLAKEKYTRVGTDLRRIENAADKMAELLEGLLELSRIGRVVNAVETIAMTELANQVVELLHEELRAKKIRVTVAEHMPAALGDKTRIREVLQNLIENAAKFIERPDGEIRIGYQDEGQEIIYFVQDNGPGIDPQYHEKIFGLFDKLHHDGEGSGIGLALVKRIVEYHGGRIWVQSDLGAGATFFFTLRDTKEGSV